jgi:hypothetical protein
MTFCSLLTRRVFVFYPIPKTSPQQSPFNSGGMLTKGSALNAVARSPADAFKIPADRLIFISRTSISAEESGKGPGKLQRHRGTPG